MDFNRKRELINKLIEEMQNMEYQRGSSNLSDFRATGEVILTKIFDKRSSHIEKFNRVIFPLPCILQEIILVPLLVVFREGKLPC